MPTSLAPITPAGAPLELPSEHQGVASGLHRYVSTGGSFKPQPDPPPEEVQELPPSFAAQCYGR